VITEPQRRGLAPYCDGCGKPVAAGVHVLCRRPLDPARYCTQCGRKLAVQVLPTQVTTKCVRCG
jgi:hypothetical protein